MPSGDDTPVAITKGSARFIGRTLREFRGRGRGEAPNRKRPRHVGGGGGGGGTSNLRDARVTVAIAAAAGNLEEDWAKDGKVKLISETTGEVSTTEIAVINTLRVAFVVDAQVEVDTAYGTPHVRNGSCGSVIWSET